MVKKFKKDVLDFGTGAVTLGLTGAVTAGTIQASGVTGLGGLSSGIRTAASFAPIAGIGIGAGAALRQVDKLRKKKRMKVL